MTLTDKNGVVIADRARVFDVAFHTATPEETTSTRAIHLVSEMLAAESGAAEPVAPKLVESDTDDAGEG